MARAKTTPTQQQSQNGDNPWPKRLIGAGGVVIVILLIVAIIAGTLNEPLGGVPEGTEENIAAGQGHVEGNIYTDEEVPAGGEHNPIWANCGFYADPIEAEFAVHSLEHGAVWITYQPEIGADDLEELRRLGSPIEKVLVSPVPGQTSPIVATAWGSQLSLDSTADARLQQFIVEFAGSFSAPEPGGACTGGVGNPQG